MAQASYISEVELDNPLLYADQIVSIPMKSINDNNLKQADIIINPDLKNIANDDFTKVDSTIKLGYLAAMKKIDEIKNNYK